MNPSLSTGTKQDSHHLLKNLFCPCVPYKETGNFREEEKKKNLGGNPWFLTRWPREVGVTEGAGRRLAWSQS